jgi:hypothetical protein
MPAEPIRPPPPAPQTTDLVGDFAADHEPLSLAAAAREPCLRRDGRSPSPSQLYRWSSAGIGGVRLEVGRVGHRKVTTRPALLRFIARLSNVAAPAPPHVTRIHKQAVQELERAGI